MQLPRSLHCASHVLAIIGCLTGFECARAEETAVPNPNAYAQEELQLPSSTAVWCEPSVPVGRKKQLLADDFVISHRYNVQRDLNQATKANDGQPILNRDKPWEKANCFQVKSVLREDGKFIMHYHYTGSPTDYCCLAESEDGVHWTKPVVGIREFEGSKENNLLDHQGSIYFLDPHETDPAHKYKSTFRPMENSPYPHAVGLAYSSDSLRWHDYNDGKPVTGRAADTLSQLAWDESAQVYRLFTRTDYGPDGKPAPGDTQFRGAREMINPDVKADPTDWTTVREWIFEREGLEELRRRQIHTVNFWQYEGIDFGLMTVMEWPAHTQLGAEKANDQRHERDNWNCYLATRRGGHECDWDLTWVYAEKPLIARGPDGAFDKDMIHSAASIVTWDDKHWIYYSGWPNGHMRHPNLPAIGLATVPLDRFICLETWHETEPGWIITKPFKVEGDRLEINGDASDGAIVVEILNEMGEPIPGFTAAEAVPLKAKDGIRLKPEWKRGASLLSLAGAKVRLKFHLDDAKLYAFQVKSTDRE